MSKIKIPFAQRFNIIDESPIVDDIPLNARRALDYILLPLYSDTSDQVLFRTELCRAGRFKTGRIHTATIEQLFSEIEWFRLYSFIEIAHERLLESKNDQALEEARQGFIDEINLWLIEENLGYEFIDGQFRRRGRAATQKSIERVGSVLMDSKLQKVRLHYNKARKFFEQLPEPDVNNCVKEALCAIEACVEIMTGKPASKNFTREIKNLQGNGEKQIPPALGESMIKLFGYRGSGDGVAHGTLEGSKVTELEAEVVLGLTSNYITYIVDLFHDEQEIPF